MFCVENAFSLGAVDILLREVGTFKNIMTENLRD
jgi:hypothetical protein